MLYSKLEYTILGSSTNLPAHWDSEANRTFLLAAFREAKNEILRRRKNDFWVSSFPLFSSVSTAQPAVPVEPLEFLSKNLPPLEKEFLENR